MRIPSAERSAAIIIIVALNMLVFTAGVSVYAERRIPAPNPNSWRVEGAGRRRGRSGGQDAGAASDTVQGGRQLEPLGLVRTGSLRAVVPHQPSSQLWLIGEKATPSQTVIVTLCSTGGPASPTYPVSCSLTFSATKNGNERRVLLDACLNAV